MNSDFQAEKNESEQQDLVPEDEDEIPAFEPPVIDLRFRKKLTDQEKIK